MIYFVTWETREPKAALPLLFFGGYKSPPDERKEGDTMITYQDLFCSVRSLLPLSVCFIRFLRTKENSRQLLAIVDGCYFITR